MKNSGGFWILVSFLLLANSNFRIILELQGFLDVIALIINHVNEFFRLRGKFLASPSPVFFGRLVPGLEDLVLWQESRKRIQAPVNIRHMLLIKG